MRTILCLAAILTVTSGVAADPLNCNLAGYKPAAGLTAAVAGDTLTLAWEAEAGREVRLRLTIERGAPTVQDIAVRRSGGPSTELRAGEWSVVVSQAKPEFRIVSGLRRMSNQQISPLRQLGVEITPEIVDAKKWDAFWDAPLDLTSKPGTGGNPPPAQGIANQPGLPRKPDEIKRATAALLDPADEFVIVAFNHQPFFLSSWTRDRSRVAGLLESLRPTGGTAAYDAVVAALPQFAVRANQRAAIVLISDGADTASDATLREVRSGLLRTDAFAYAIAIDPPSSQAINTRVNPVALQEITDTSGGRTEVVRGTDEILPAVGRIAEELNNQYLLGYSSRRPADGQYHSIRVRVTGGEHRVRARSGYVAPAREDH